MVTKKMAGHIALFSIVIGIFGSALLGLAAADSGSSTYNYMPLDESTLFQQVSGGVQNSSLISLGGLSDAISIFVASLPYIIMIVLAYLFAVKILLPFLNK
ncbi:MAG: hypothetical protein QXH07_01195 [Thermoplasmata archaeon]